MKSVALCALLVLAVAALGSAMIATPSTEALDEVDTIEQNELNALFIETDVEDEDADEDVDVTEAGDDEESEDEDEEEEADDEEQQDEEESDSTDDEEEASEEEASLISVSSALHANAPPYEGTVFIDGDIISAAKGDKTAYKSVAFKSTGSKYVYDRRKGWITIPMHVFGVTNSDGLALEAWVNPEFGTQVKAKPWAEKYAKAYGYLPKSVRSGTKTLVIHKGNNPFGGANGVVTIHTDMGATYEKGWGNVLEEALCHEGGHAALDPKYAANAQWLAAQKADPAYISTYARDNPTREDVAETLVPYLGVIKNRLSAADKDKVKKAVPKRLAFFDSVNVGGVSGGATVLAKLRNAVATVASKLKKSPPPAQGSSDVVPAGKKF